MPLRPASPNLACLTLPPSLQVKELDKMVGHLFQNKITVSSLEIDVFWVTPLLPVDIHNLRKFPSIQFTLCFSLTDNVSLFIYLSHYYAK